MDHRPVIKAKTISIQEENIGKKCSYKEIGKDFLEYKSTTHKRKIWID